MLLVVLADVVVPGLGSTRQEGGDHEGWHFDLEVALSYNFHFKFALVVSVNTSKIVESVSSNNFLRSLS